MSSLNVKETRRDDFNAKGLLWVRLLETKTTKKDQAPKLHLKGRGARAVVHWLGITGLKDGPLFRAVSKADRSLPRRLAPDALRTTLRYLPRLAG